MHAGYLPLTVSAEHGSWFGFCAAEGDLDAVEGAVVAAHGAWLSMLQTTNLNKSYKMVVLRVLLDHDSLWTGMEIGELAAACRSFLEDHPALRADLASAAFTRVPGDPEAEARSFAEWWLAWPLSRWMDDQSGRRWFARRGDRFVADFPCDADLRGALESLTSELVDYRLAQYTRSRLRAEPVAGPAGPGSVRFVAKVSHTAGKPILFLPTVESQPGRPAGPTVVRLPDGSEWVFRFVKVACNVAHPAGSAAGAGKNELPALLREWFGESAGLPGTAFEVEFGCRDGAWTAAPLGAAAGPASAAPSRSTLPPALPLVDSPPPSARYVTHVPVYDLTAAAGSWGPESVPEEIGWTEVPGVSLAPGMFVARVTGKSMEPLIPDGSWCLFRPCPAGSREGRIVLVQFSSLGAGDDGGRFTVKKYHSEKTVTADGWRHERIELRPVNPEFGAIEIEAEEGADVVVVGEFVKTIPPA